MGLDYAPLGSTVNRNPETGIRYGILNLNAARTYWDEDAELVDSPPACPNCGNEIDLDFEHDDIEYNEDGLFVCPSCEEAIDLDTIETEIIGLKYEHHHYSLYQSTDDSDLWVFESPFYTIAGFCSPCAPGAVYLTDDTPDAKGYCLGHDWFEDGKAPYTVYDVKTGEEVKP